MMKMPCGEVEESAGGAERQSGGPQCGGQLAARIASGARSETAAAVEPGN